MMRTLIILTALIFVTTAGANVFDDLSNDWRKLMAEEEWQSFKVAHNKQYESDDVEQYRKEIFMANKKMIDDHNEKYNQGLSSYEQGVNEFTDMLLHEVTSTMTGYKPNNSTLYDGSLTFLRPANVLLPTAIDWRAKGAVTAVKRQGRCGSCWAFATTGVLEGQLFLKTKQLISLSEQNLIDCSKENHGCDGGFAINAYRYIMRNHGISTESSYPYEHIDGSCRYKRSNVDTSIKNFVQLTPGNEKMLMQAVATIGPIAIAIDSTHDSFIKYQHGVYDEPACSSHHLNHEVLIVGYGNERGQDYWLVKNQWGTGWGENGYIKMRRNHGNQCGIASEASYPVV